LLVLAGGAAVTVDTVTRATRPHERTLGNYLIALSAFVGLAILTYALRTYRRASIGMFCGALLASGLAFLWWTNPFGEWTGLSMLFLIPVQWACGIFGLIGLFLSKDRK